MARRTEARVGTGGWGGTVAALGGGCLAVLLLLPAATLRAAPADANGALSEARLLQAALDDVTGLVAAFTQTVESPALPSPQVESGTVYLLRPGRMRFEYSHPRGKLAIADGEQAYVYLPEDHQALVSPLARTGTGMELLLRPRLDLAREFAIDWGPPAAKDGHRPLRLVPRGGTADYQTLLLETGPDHLPRVLVVIDALGGRITYRFTDLRKVATLDAGLFRFTPPPGVEVQRVGP
jgi:outer membrane lipoprotein carrier protein